MSASGAQHREVVIHIMHAFSSSFPVYLITEY